MQTSERILVQASNNATPTAAETKELMVRESRAKIKKDFIRERCNTLQAEIVGYKDTKDMSNDEVCFALKESQDWEKESSEIVSLQQAYLEGCISLGNNGDQQEVQDAVSNLLYNINRKVQSRGNEDKRRGLNTRSENKGRDTVVYPDIFPGVLGDNVY